MRSRRLLLLCALAPSCNFAAEDVATVPDKPTFAAHVQPILADHCVLCHSDKPSRGAPTYFRLDVYDSTTTVPSIRGAKAMRFTIGQQIESNSMPPAAAWGDGLGDNARATVLRWIAQDGPP